ncbi:hypothetical protein KIPB_003335 [Kipferlia bialata]|uniref:Uncharacterized protein n=1 Tax=Kipferlia bialata TaxID=797122 RepID=A0A9K3CTQ4_9EUKA|nr:hypothetical protein KIPB_003335 [Kipferlia bialata]|eukprot:g3335.t1
MPSLPTLVGLLTRYTSGVFDPSVELTLRQYVQSDPAATETLFQAFMAEECPIQARNAAGAILLGVEMGTLSSSILAGVLSGCCGMLATHGNPSQPPSPLLPVLTSLIGAILAVTPGTLRRQVLAELVGGSLSVSTHPSSVQCLLRGRERGMAMGAEPLQQCVGLCLQTLSQGLEAGSPDVTTLHSLLVLSLLDDIPCAAEGVIASILSAAGTILQQYLAMPRAAHTQARTLIVYAPQYDETVCACVACLEFILTHHYGTVPSHLCESAVALLFSALQQIPGASASPQGSPLSMAVSERVLVGWVAILDGEVPVGGDRERDSLCETLIRCLSAHLPPVDLSLPSPYDPYGGDADLGVEDGELAPSVLLTLASLSPLPPAPVSRALSLSPSNESLAQSGLLAMCASPEDLPSELISSALALCLSPSPLLSLSATLLASYVPNEAAATPGLLNHMVSVLSRGEGLSPTHTATVCDTLGEVLPRVGVDMAQAQSLVHSVSGVFGHLPHPPALSLFACLQAVAMCLSDVGEPALPLLVEIMSLAASRIEREAETRHGLETVRVCLEGFEEDTLSAVAPALSCLVPSLSSFLSSHTEAVLGSLATTSLSAYGDLDEVVAAVEVVGEVARLNAPLVDPLLQSVVPLCNLMHPSLSMACFGVIGEYAGHQAVPAASASASVSGCMESVRIAVFMQTCACNNALWSVVRCLARGVVPEDVGTILTVGIDRMLSCPHQFGQVSPEEQMFVVLVLLGIARGVPEALNGYRGCAEALYSRLGGVEDPDDMALCLQGLECMVSGQARGIAVGCEQEYASRAKAMVEGGM